MNASKTLRWALAECAAVAGNWCRPMGGARDDPDRVARLAELTPRVMAGIMGAAADALEATSAGKTRPKGATHGH